MGLKKAGLKEVFVVRIVFEDGLEAVARRIAKAVGGDCVRLGNVMEAPDVLGEANCVGMVYFKCGKDIDDSMVRFARHCLGSIELKGLEYLFSLCVCEGNAKPQYALKVVNRLCAHAGCLPSYSRAVSMGDDGALDEVCRDLSKEAIRLADGSPFVGLYMRANKRRFMDAKTRV